LLTGYLLGLTIFNYAIVVLYSLGIRSFKWRKLINSLYNEECLAPKGKQFYSCLGTAEICQLFYLAAKMAQLITANLVFN